MTWSYYTHQKVKPCEGNKMIVLFLIINYQLKECKNVLLWHKTFFNNKRLNTFLIRITIFQHVLYPLELRPYHCFHF